MSSITETLKSKLDDLDLDRRVDELTVVAEKAVKRAVGHVGELAHDNRERVAGLLDKAGSCLLYTSPSPRDRTRSRMPSSA